MKRTDLKDPSSRRKRMEKWFKYLLSVCAEGFASNPKYTEVITQLGDLAMFEPETFWLFIEVVSESSVSAEQISGLGRNCLYWLLRHHPDSYDERLAGLARRDARFRCLLREIDPDRIAPDVWRQMESALTAGET